MSTFNHTVTNLSAWGISRGILNTDDHGKTRGDAAAQIKKAAEETTEAALAIGSGDKTAIADELGDVGVTWVMTTLAAGLDPATVLANAYTKIKHRTGKKVNGQFVKD